MIGQAFHLPLHVVFHDLANPCGHLIISCSSFPQYLWLMMSWWHNGNLLYSWAEPNLTCSKLCHCLCMSDYSKWWLQVSWPCQANPDFQSRSFSDLPLSFLCVAILRFKKNIWSHWRKTDNWMQIKQPKHKIFEPVFVSCLFFLQKEWTWCSLFQIYLFYETKRGENIFPWNFPASVTLIMVLEWLLWFKWWAVCDYCSVLDKINALLYVTGPWKKNLRTCHGWTNYLSSGCFF